MLPLNYFLLLLDRLPNVYLLTHSRVRREIEAISNIETDKIYYIPDTILHIWLYKIGLYLPDRIAEVTTGALSHLVTQLFQIFLTKRIVRERNITVIHEPSPVSPKQPSIIFGLGIPVVIGPMNGGMDFPLAFAKMAGYTERALFFVFRILSMIYNLVIPGKLFADYLLVANERTRRALPPFRFGKVVELVENGVFRSKIVPASKPQHRLEVIEILYVGRLVDFKRVDIVISALAAAASERVILTVVGDGPKRAALEHLAASITPGRVVFTGSVPHRQILEYYDRADIFVLPSVRECGGAVVLEAMARGLPVIATNWGGPADYITAETGILVEPYSEESMIKGFASAIDLLASSEALREKLGGAAVTRILENFTWESKADRIVEIYRTAIAGMPRNGKIVSR